jgi:hypothetical protein
MDQGDLATRLSGINLSPPAASSTQGECGDVVRQRQDSVLYHQTPPASHDGKILANDPDMRLREVNGEWRLFIGDYDHPEICLLQVDIVFYDPRKAIGLLHSAYDQPLQIAVSGYKSTKETAYQQSNSETTDKALAIINELEIGFRLRSLASHVEPQLLTRIWSDPDSASRTYTIFINREICSSCKPVLEAAARKLGTHIDVLTSIDAKSKAIKVVQFHPSGKTEGQLQR